MNLLLNIIGVLLIVLALAHAAFPKYFNWRQELASLSIINREMFYVHSFFIAFVVLLIGVLSLTSADELMHTVIGKRISLALGIFWLTRLGVQFWGYSSQNWKGKTFETTIHVVFSILWAFMGIVYIKAYLV